VRAVPRLCEFYPGVCLKTEEKARKNLNQGKKNLSQVKKILSQSTVSIHITKNTHTLRNHHKHTEYRRFVISNWRLGATYRSHPSRSSNPLLYCWILADWIYAFNEKRNADNITQTYAALPP
jgi:hypothetical protein